MMLIIRKSILFVENILHIRISKLYTIMYNMIYFMYICVKLYKYE